MVVNARLNGDTVQMTARSGGPPYCRTTRNLPLQTPPAATSIVSWTKLLSRKYSASSIELLG